MCSKWKRYLKGFKTQDSQETISLSKKPKMAIDHPFVSVGRVQGILAKITTQLACVFSVKHVVA